MDYEELVDRAQMAQVPQVQTQVRSAGSPNSSALYLFGGRENGLWSATSSVDGVVLSQMFTNKKEMLTGRQWFDLCSGGRILEVR